MYHILPFMWGDDVSGIILRDVVTKVEKLLYGSGRHKRNIATTIDIKGAQELAEENKAMKMEIKRTREELKRLKMKVGKL